ncbi:MAG: 2-oxoacid:acceptor oxidoreductase family protein [Deltaproteobacteria bacterium]|nr:2-oxoacid:acceptor oxidoreductase family protein [Deltaproteobacteria bacterium]
MKHVDFILGGLGGQGILFMTKVLARAAVEKGFRVMGAETHGMAQRGGSVVSHLRLGEVESTLVREGAADIVLALEANEAYRNIPFLKPGGQLYVNASDHTFPREAARSYLDKKAIVYRSAPAAEIALEMGAPMATNLALLGFFSAFQKEPIGYEELKETIEKISPERFRKVNLRVLEAGFNQAGA